MESALSKQQTMLRMFTMLYQLPMMELISMMVVTMLTMTMMILMMIPLPDSKVHMNQIKAIRKVRRGVKKALDNFFDKVSVRQHLNNVKQFFYKGFDVSEHFYAMKAA